jgi:hypothetical protein
MPKTGKLFLTVLSWCFMALFLAPVQAQNVQVDASVSESQAFTGDYIELKITVSGDGFKRLSKPQLPATIEGFRVVSSNPSTSRSIQIINGKTSSSYGYGYYLVAEKEGTHTIPAIRIEVDDTPYQTEPIRVKIIDRNAGRANPTTNNSSTPDSDRPDIYLELEVDQKNPVVGQQVVASMVLYFKNTVDIQSYSPVAGWKAEGFWKEELTNPSRPSTEGVILDGIRYRKAQLLQYALFPSKSGKLELSPFEIGVNLRYSNNRRDPFSSVFGGFGTNQRNVSLKSNALTLNVRDYEVPEGVIDVGAVGNFRISRSLSISDVLEGETIEILTQFSGEGNVPLLVRPEYELPSTLEIYEPQEKVNINRTSGIISGRKVFTELVVARQAGDYQVPETKLGFYDPKARRYKIVSLPAIDFKVSPDPRRRGLVAENQSTLTVQPWLGLATWVAVQDGESFSIAWFLWIFGFCLLAGSFAYKQYRDRMHSDTGFARAQRADKKAQSRLEEGLQKAESGDVKSAYGFIHQSLTGYISDKANQPEAGLSDAAFAELAEQMQLNEEALSRLKALLNKCSTIRFAPNSSLSDYKLDVEEAKMLLQRMKSEFKKRAEVEVKA